MNKRRHPDSRVNIQEKIGIEMNLINSASKSDKIVVHDISQDYRALTRRPPHFTVLPLVKDAAARLPASIGTKADICTLARDSQFIMEDISDLQGNQVVSRALDRLRYERDPCIRYDRDFRLWVYLHGEREDGEFEDHGPCPRKKSRQVDGMQSASGGR